jgi:hypothetical protein
LAFDAGFRMAALPAFDLSFQRGLLLCVWFSPSPSLTRASVLFDSITFLYFSFTSELSSFLVKSLPSLLLLLPHHPWPLDTPPINSASPSMLMLTPSLTK